MLLPEMLRMPETDTFVPLCAFFCTFAPFSAYAPSGLGVLLVDCVIGGLLYVNFTESTNSSTQQAGGEEVDIEAGLRRPLRRIRPRGR